MQNNLLEYLEKTVVSAPERIAFSSDAESLTFQQVYDEARAIGSGLLRAGFHRRPVAVYMQRSPQTIVAFLGALYAGCYYVPVDEAMPKARIGLITEQLGAFACLCDAHTLPLAGQLLAAPRASDAHTLSPAKELLPESAQVAGSESSPCFLYEELARGEIDDRALAVVRKQHIDTDPAYIVYTSGSTGIPKGVIGSHRAAIDYAESFCDVMRFAPDTIFGNQTPLYFDACLKEILPTLKLGLHMHLIPPRLFLMPARLVEYLNSRQINTICWVTSALVFISSLHTFDEITPRYLRTVAFASEVFPIRQLKLWRKALPKARFINLYGPTETTGICCYYEVDREFSDREQLPIGRPFPNTEILLLTPDGRRAGAGEEGEICIRGTRLTHGYYRDEARTNEAFVQNPLQSLYPERIYRTGDIGTYNDRGELVFLSRVDLQIKHMGHRIELGEIEAAACSHEQVRSCCCLYDREKKKLQLYYTGDSAPAELLRFLRERLPRYMVPHTARRLDELPLLPNGKLDRRGLEKKIKMEESQ